MNEKWRERPSIEAVEAAIAARREEIGPATPEQLTAVEHMMEDVMTKILGRQWQWQAEREEMDNILPDAADIWRAQSRTDSMDDSQENS